MAFQQRFAPNLEQTGITSVTHSPEGFTLTTQTGERFLARRVVVAVGITHFEYIPPILADLPPDLVSHSSQHTEVSQFRGRTVAVVGAGASAGDLAGLLQEAGANVHLIARRDTIKFHDPPEHEPRPLTKRILMPRSGLGQGWPARLCTDLPLVFHALPANFRLRAVQRVNGPAPGWFAKSKVVGHVTLHLSASLNQASKNSDGIHLHLAHRDANETNLHVDHIIAATGYRPDLSRLRFLAEPIQSQIRTIANAPALSPDFQSSIPGLYFVGIAAANTFGPMMRFAYGANYTAHRLAAHLHKQIEK